MKMMVFRGIVLFMLFTVRQGTVGGAKSERKPCGFGYCDPGEDCCHGDSCIPEGSVCCGDGLTSFHCKSGQTCCGVIFCCLSAYYCDAGECHWCGSRDCAENKTTQRVLDLITRVYRATSSKSTTSKTETTTRRRKKSSGKLATTIRAICVISILICVAQVCFLVSKYYYHAKKDAVQNRRVTAFHNTADQTCVSNQYIDVPVYAVDRDRSNNGNVEENTELSSSPPAYDTVMMEGISHYQPAPF